ncbi:abortive infection family protein, partial [Acinetobacter baumannii]|nr:abortive infection family protein [Acinetobacter baumannii]
FRTHASSAHGQGRKLYNIKPRHARLAIHSAHTLALFILETWDEKRAKKC